MLKTMTVLNVKKSPPNCQLRVLNPFVYDTVRGCRHCHLPVNVGTMSALLENQPFGLTNAFGFSGTIASVVLTTSGSISNHCLASTSRAAYRHMDFSWRTGSHPFAQKSLPCTDGAETFRSSVKGKLLALVAGHVVHGLSLIHI